MPSSKLSLSPHFLYISIFPLPLSSFLPNPQLSLSFLCGQKRRITRRNRCKTKLVAKIRDQMMMEKDQDLGLSLSLSSSSSSAAAAAAAARLVPQQLALIRPSSSSSSSPTTFHPFPYSSSSCHPKPQWSDLLLLSHQDRRPMSDMALLRGIDVNRAPSSATAVAATERDSEEDGGASSPNSTVSSVSGAAKRTERDPGVAGGEDLDAERASSRGPASDEEDGEGSRKKLRLSKDQSAVLEESFKEHNTLNPKQKMALAKQLNLRPRQVEVWFQNRRARTKLKQTEVDCEFLKRCCENLTEENRRLQKEVMELRALKLSPQFYMHMTPPTTLTMCPSCERVSNSAAAAVGSGPTNSSQPANTTSTTPPGPPEQHHQFLHHHQPASPAPWAPIPIRPSFLDAPPQRS